MSVASSPIRSYRDLKVWRRAVALTTACYRLTTGFPKHETYGLTVQIRRSAVSVASNIAEGHGRRRTRDYLRFLSIANGSLMELETQLVIAGNLKYVAPDAGRRLLARSMEVGRMLAGLIRALRKQLATQGIRNQDPGFRRAPES